MTLKRLASVQEQRIHPGAPIGHHHHLHQHFNHLHNLHHFHHLHHLRHLHRNDFYSIDLSLRNPWYIIKKDVKKVTMSPHNQTPVSDVSLSPTPSEIARLPTGSDTGRQKFLFHHHHHNKPAEWELNDQHWLIDIFKSGYFVWKAYHRHNVTMSLSSLIIMIV